MYAYANYVCLTGACITTNDDEWRLFFCIIFHHEAPKDTKLARTQQEYTSGNKLIELMWHRCIDLE